MSVQSVCCWRESGIVSKNKIWLLFGRHKFFRSVREGECVNVLAVKGSSFWLLQERDERAVPSRSIAEWQVKSRKRELVTVQVLLTQTLTDEIVRYQTAQSHRQKESHQVQQTALADTDAHLHLSRKWCVIVCHVPNGPSVLILV